MDIASQLILWFRENKRNLPWRDTKDPYLIWLSEILLQQTRVEQGMNYYHSFVRHFPTVQKLASAPANKIMKLWQGLGYYSRAVNLHQTAKQIVKDYDGKLPEVIETLQKLKGVGNYTASAIASFAFNQPYAVVDGNVIRVISRIFGITEPVDKSSAMKEIRKIATQLLPVQQAGIFNQAIMEFGALQCRPKNPLCHECIMNKICQAFKKKLVNVIPVKTKKLIVKSRYLNYLFITRTANQEEFTYIKKRTGKDIWHKLYDFPCIETSVQTEPGELFLSKEWKSVFNKRKFIIQSVSGIYKHKLTHQTIYARFYEVKIKSALAGLPQHCRQISRGELAEYAIPRLMEKYLQSIQEL